MSHTVRFRITTSTGEVYEGPVHGSGGLIGAGASHCAPDVQEVGALTQLRREVARADEGRALSIYEPKPGHCALKPHYTGQSDGPVVPVPLKGASVEILNPSPRSIAGRVRLAKQEINEDIASGRVPCAVRGFVDLHDYVDANEYGALCSDIPALPDGSVDWDACNAVQDEIDQWLKKGGHR